MKITILKILIFTSIFTYVNQLKAGIAPTFNMTVKNIQTTTPESQLRDSILTFEVYLQQTNFGQAGVDQFEYCAGQFTWIINREVMNGNLTLGLSNAAGANQLPFGLRPPTFQIDTTLAPERELYLMCSGNLPNPQANFFISPVFPGTKILTFRLRTSANRFPIVPLNIKFKFGDEPNSFLSYFKPYPDGWDSDYFPYQTAVSLMDTNINHYSIDNPSYILGGVIKINLTSIPEGKYNSTFNILSRKDSITVYLRSSFSPFNLVDSAVGLVDSLSFSSSLTFPTATSGNYYIVIKHYQCIETWSKSGGENIILDGTFYNYDFTSSISQAYGNNLKQKGSKYCLFSGDINQDGYISLVDILPIYNDAKSFISGSYLVTDLTGDRVVDLTDITLSYNNSINFIRVRQP